MNEKWNENQKSKNGNPWGIDVLALDEDNNESIEWGWDFALRFESPI